MGDRAYTTLLAWPYPGREHLPADVVDALQRDDLMPESDLPDRDEDCFGDGSYVLTGDAESGLILKIVDCEANYGTCAFAELTGLLTAAGVSVWASNEAGGDYGASWEYHAGAPDTAASGGRMDRGELVLAANDLLSGDETCLDGVSDSDLAARTRRLLALPDAIPAVVKAASL